MNVDALLEKFKFYKKLNKSKHQLTPNPCKLASGRSGNHRSNKHSGGGHRNDKQDTTVYAVEEGENEESKVGGK